MIKQTSCIFYDGKSSVPQHINLSLNLATATLAFENATGQSIKWDLKAVSLTKKGAALNLEHGQNPIQNIIITDLPFIDRIQSLKKSHHPSWYSTLISYGIKLHVALAILILAVIGLSYVFVIPWIAEKSVVLIPEEYDDKLGEMFFEQSILFDSVDVAKTKTLNLFAKELQLNNTKKLKFTVVDSETINAFALPDGNIVVYSGIIDSMKNYDELVALLGHEASHVNNRHSMKMMCRSLSGYLFVSAILGDVNGIMAIVGDNVNNLQSLSFSREFEQQADADGFQILLQNKIDPKGMSNLFKRLDDHSNIIPEFLSSHPITKERIIFVDKKIKGQTFKITENPKLQTLFKDLQNETIPN